MEKTKPEARRVLAGVMDDRQMISIQKANIHKEMRVHAASLHMANPKNGGAWDDNRDIYENTGFEPWYLGRFDAQFIFRDEVDEEKDRKVIRHYLSQFGQKKGSQKGQDTLSVPDLRAWFLHVRSHYHPELIPNSEPAILIENEYMKLRAASKAMMRITSEEGEAKYQRVTMSDAGALIRFAKASARACMRNTLETVDVKRAIRVVTGSIASATFQGEVEEANGELSKEDKKLIKTIDIQASASKEFKLIEKKKQQQYKTFGRVVQKLGFNKCKLCHGTGTYYEASREYDCTQCNGQGGEIVSLDMSYLESVLKERGFSRMDISDIATTYTRRGLLKTTKDGRLKIINLTHFEIASKELGGNESDEDILSRIPENITDRYSGLLGKQAK
jgi:DNA replicative helicase MCM subunit Mcm2 (Cdc46/Mcm family)